MIGFGKQDGGGDIYSQREQRTRKSYQLATAERKAGLRLAGRTTHIRAKIPGLNQEAAEASQAPEQSIQSTLIQLLPRGEPELGCPRRVGGGPGWTHMATGGVWEAEANQVMQ